MVLLTSKPYVGDESYYSQLNNVLDEHVCQLMWVLVGFRLGEWSFDSVCNLNRYREYPEISYASSHLGSS